MLINITFKKFLHKKKTLNEKQMKNLIKGCSEIKLQLKQAYKRSYILTTWVIISVKKYLCRVRTQYFAILD